jgi:5S rRNA maturation endonuclease (ribonuclease M5)
LEKKRVKQVLPGSGGLGREVAQTMYTYVSKCKNNKIEGEEKKEYNNKKIKIEALF